jgi:hypothetical protein
MTARIQLQKKNLAISLRMDVTEKNWMVVNRLS